MYYIFATMYLIGCTQVALLSKCCAADTFVDRCMNKSLPSVQVCIVTVLSVIDYVSAALRT